MYRNTRFGDLMKGLSRGFFDRTVERLSADKHNKGFRCWDQLLAMVYAQLSGCRSLREIEAGFNSQTHHHYHLGSREVKRSTLADANASRPCGLFAALCGGLMQQAHRKLKRELQDVLYLLDSTPISLEGLGFDWCQESRTPRTQGLKVHLVLAPEQGLPAYQQTTSPNVNDIEVGRVISLEQGATYVFDKAYCDYNWWHAIHQQDALFVTRFKKNASLKVEEHYPIPSDAQASILEDTKVSFRHKHPGGKRLNRYHGTTLRKVVVDRPGHNTPLILATNDFERSAQAIADLYKARWAIELFFKWLKQNLKLKQFYGRCENAVKIQIYTAPIAYLLVYLARQRQGSELSMHLYLATLRSSLFQRPEIDRIVEFKRRRQQSEIGQLQGSLLL